MSGSPHNSSSSLTGVLRRDLGVFGAVMLGLGSILGTGVFVSIGLGAAIAGPAVVLAIGLAALVATCNGLSSAQLAARHPVSGGTYEYGYRELTPVLGFTAGWMFLCAKSASAATAALGFAGYVLNLVGDDTRTWLIPLALVAVLALTILVLTGVRRSSVVNIVIVGLTLATLLFFIIAGASTAAERAATSFESFFGSSNGEGGGWFDSTQGLLHATALMFVAYTGYGRIATLGEEVHEPKRTIPRAIVATLVVSMLLYVGVAFVGVSIVGADAFANATTERAAPLEIVARQFGVPGAGWILAVGAVTAMLGVLLNLLLGLSRVLLAMGRRGDMPGATARIESRHATPWVATIVVAVVIGSLVLIGNVKTTWTFSAFTVLIYYSLTNLAALRLSQQERLFPRWIAAAGLAACLFLAFWVDTAVWLAGLGLIAFGVVWHLIARRLASRRTVSG